MKSKDTQKSTRIFFFDLVSRVTNDSSIKSGWILHISFRKVISPMKNKRGSKKGHNCSDYFACSSWEQFCIAWKDEAIFVTLPIRNHDFCTVFHNVWSTLNQPKEEKGEIYNVSENWKKSYSNSMLFRKKRKEKKIALSIIESNTLFMSSMPRSSFGFSYPCKSVNLGETRLVFVINTIK